MKNLAGKKTVISDEVISGELSKANIIIKESLEYIDREVSTNFYGKISHWIFVRAWYYWRVNSDLGLDSDIARTMNHKHGDHIRVGGFAAGVGDHEIKSLNVYSYHIDTQEGLNHFVKTVDI